MNKKDFDRWNKLKKKLDKQNVKPPIVNEGEIWWTFMGENLGREISGKGEIFGRPVLIFRKINEITFSCIPLTTSEKVFTKWKYKIDVMDKQSYLCFDQIKTMDYRRLKIMIRQISGEEIQRIRDAFASLYNRADPLAGAGHRVMRSDASAVALTYSISDSNSMSSLTKVIKHDYGAESIDIHMSNGGKIGLSVKVPLETRDDLSRAYTPGVAAVCLAISGDKDNNKIIEEQIVNARNLTLKKNTVAIISDGTAVLGLGDIGPYGAIPVMEGKAAILKRFADVDAFPICIDNRDVESIIQTVKNIAPVFGAINLEDIAAPKCFEIEERLRRELNIPVMHDDQWGTATVVLAATINVLKLKNINKEKIKVIVNGVGAAGVAVSRLLLDYGVKDILFCDSKGLIHKGRNDLNKEKVELLESSTADTTVFMSDLRPSGIVVGGVALAEAIRSRDMFIGLSKPGALTPDMIRSMNINPIILSLANPIPEIMPEQAREAGAYIVATGRSDYPNQLNNSLIFPGLFKGMLRHEVRQFDNSIFVRAAHALANHVTELDTNNILPSMFDDGLVEVIANSVIKR